MRKVSEVLRLKYDQGRSNREIAAACSIGAATVHDYLCRARTAGVGWPLPPDLNDAELEARLFPSVLRVAEVRTQPDFDHIARELRRKGVTLFLLWEEYHQAHAQGYGYSRFCELYRAWAGRLEPRLRQTHIAGEKLFVDYAGHSVPIVNRTTGEIHEAAVFVATLGASDYTYAETTWTQSLPDWIGSHVRAFEFLGGVPAIVVPDNLKTGVKAPCYYEPDLNSSYQEMAEHYQVAVIPTRVAKPRDKAKVENHVLQVERRVLAPLRDRTFFSLEECNRAMREQLEQLNLRPFQQLKGSRQQLFETLDRLALRPLPVEPYCFALWKQARVNIDYHIAVEHCFYSVPYRLIKHEVQVRITQRTIEVFHQRQRVASHARCFQANRHITTDAHMPKAHQAYLDWTPERLMQWAGTAGPATAKVVETIMASRAHPQQGFRSCLGIMRLGQRYGSHRLQAACARALEIGSPRYKSIESILSHKLDQAAPSSDQIILPCPDHANVRGATYYQTKPTQEKVNQEKANQDNANQEESNQEKVNDPC